MSEDITLKWRTYEHEWQSAAIERFAVRIVAQSRERTAVVPCSMVCGEQDVYFFSKGWFIQKEKLTENKRTNFVRFYLKFLPNHRDARELMLAATASTGAEKLSRIRQIPEHSSLDNLVVG